LTLFLPLLGGKESNDEVLAGSEEEEEGEHWRLEENPKKIAGHMDQLGLEAVSLW
jgi:hypothetical protein